MKKIYIRNHAAFAGKWIYEGFYAAWKSRGFLPIYYNTLDEISGDNYDLMAIDHDIQTSAHLEVIRRSDRAYLFVQPTSFPKPWGLHPNFISQMPEQFREEVNGLPNVHKWSFAKTQEIEYYSEWGDVETVHLAYDSLNYKLEDNSCYEYDVCYVGGWADNGFNEKRSIILEHLGKFKNSSLKCAFSVNRGISHEQENLLLSRSKVALNIHDAYQRSLGLDLNERTFKGLALSGILVTDNVRVFSEVFPEIPTYQSSSEMIDLVGHYCSLPEHELADLRQFNQKKVLENHTYIQRVNQFLNL